MARDRRARPFPGPSPAIAKAGKGAGRPRSYLPSHDTPTDDTSGASATRRPLRTGDLYDVIVVGARAAGAATAMLLARHGLRTLLLDQGPGGSDTLSTHALMRGGVLQLSPLGPARRDHRRGHAAGEADDVPLRRRARRHQHQAVARRRRALRTAPDASSTRCSCRRGRSTPASTCTTAPSVTDLIERDGRVVGVHATTADGRAVELGAPLVIGADGIHSTVAQHVGGAVLARGRPRGRRDVRVLVEPRRPTATSGSSTRTPARGVIPTNNGQACVFASASPRTHRPRRRRVIRDIVAERAPELADALRTRGRRRAARGPGAAIAATSAARTAPGGRSSATPATSRIRSARTGSPTRSATPSCSPAPSIARLRRRRVVGRRARRTTRRTRDRLEHPAVRRRRPHRRPRMERRGDRPAAAAAQLRHGRRSRDARRTRTGADVS